MKKASPSTSNSFSSSALHGSSAGSFSPQLNLVAQADASSGIRKRACGFACPSGFIKKVVD